MTTNLEAISLANHDFSFSLYNELAKTQTGNLFYSPLSIHVIMFMASVGAVSKTFDEMVATLHLNKTTHSLDAYKKLLEDLTDDQDYVKLANGMFVDTQFNVKESFVSNSKTYLKSSLEKLNFQKDPEAQRQFINNWVLGKTNNKIKDLFSPGSIDSSTTLVLANAVHFKSGWEHKFNEAVNEPFYLTPSSQVNVKMMKLHEDLQYYHDDKLKFAALELPYEHYAFKMIILLPDAKDGLKNLENNFAKISLHEISKKMSKHDVTVKLPRFKLEQSLKLKETLSKLGCPTMFTGEANFTNIVDSNILVSEVVHKAYINVDENGTEAAAATGIPFMLTSLIEGPPKPKVQFIINHPFIVSILTQSNNVLFMGRVSKV